MCTQTQRDLILPPKKSRAKLSPEITLKVAPLAKVSGVGDNCESPALSPTRPPFDIFEPPSRPIPLSSRREAVYSFAERIAFLSLTRGRITRAIIARAPRLFLNVAWQPPDLSLALNFRDCAAKKMREPKNWTERSVSPTEFILAPCKWMSLGLNWALIQFQYILCSLTETFLADNNELSCSDVSNTKTNVLILAEAWKMRRFLKLYNNCKFLDFCRQYRLWVVDYLEATFLIIQ